MLTERLAKNTYKSLKEYFRWYNIIYDIITKWNTKYVKLLYPREV